MHSLTTCACRLFLSQKAHLNFPQTCKIRVRDEGINGPRDNMSSTNIEPKALAQEVAGADIANGGKESFESDQHPASPYATRANPPHAQQQPIEHERIPTTQDDPAKDEAATDITTSQAQHGRLSKTVALLSATWSYLKTRCEQIRWAVAVLSLVFGFIGLFTLWPSVTAARDGTRAVKLAEWDARKSYREYCEAVSCSALSYEDFRSIDPMV